MLELSRLRQLLSYDPDTGLFHRRVAVPGTVVGARAGTIAPNDYERIYIDRRSYLAHRLAWFYVHGQWPVGELDHINRVKSDNRLCNLREATPAQNSANRGTRSDNKSGFKGVYWSRSGWVAVIGRNGTRRFLGRHPTAEAAAAAYMEAANG